MYRLKISGIQSISLAASCALLASCAGQQPVQRPPEVPRATRATCNAVSVQATSMPLQQDADTLSVLAVVPMPEPNTPAPRERLAFISEVNRSRTDEPEDLFRRAPEQLCPPDTNVSTTAVTPFSPTPVIEK